MALINIDLSNINTEDQSKLLPVGTYQMQIVQSEMRQTKAGDGEYLWLELEILGPKYAGRKFWERLNLFNKNEIAVNVAKKKLAKICASCGIYGTIADTQQLHFKPINVLVKHKENKKGELEHETFYGDNNVKPEKETAPAAAPAAPAASAPKPWEKHKK